MTNYPIKMQLSDWSNQKLSRTDLGVQINDAKTKEGGLEYFGEHGTKVFAYLNEIKNY